MGEWGVIPPGGQTSFVPHSSNRLSVASSVSLPDSSPTGVSNIPFFAKLSFTCSTACVLCVLRPSSAMSLGRPRPDPWRHSTPPG